MTFINEIILRMSKMNTLWTFFVNVIITYTFLKSMYKKHKPKIKMQWLINALYIVVITFTGLVIPVSLLYKILYAQAESLSLLDWVYVMINCILICSYLGLCYFIIKVLSITKDLKD